MDSTNGSSDAIPKQWPLVAVDKRLLTPTASATNAITMLMDLYRTPSPVVIKSSLTPAILV